MKRIYHPENKTWSFPDGSGVVTEERRINLELFDTKWRIRHLEGKVDLEEMSKELDKITNSHPTERNI